MPSIPGCTATVFNCPPIHISWSASKPFNVVSPDSVFETITDNTEVNFTGATSTPSGAAVRFFVEGIFGSSPADFFEENFADFNNRVSWNVSGGAEMTSGSTLFGLSGVDWIPHNAGNSITVTSAYTQFQNHQLSACLVSVAWS
jgi:hypothetical protein